MASAWVDAQFTALFTDCSESGVITVENKVSIPLLSLEFIWEFMLMGSAQKAMPRGEIFV